MPETRGAAEDSSTTSTASRPVDLSAIPASIQAYREAVEAKVEGIYINLSLLCQDLCKVSERATEAEIWISTTEDDVGTLKCQVSLLQSSVAVLTDKAGDDENLLSLNNLCLIGLPEEGRDPNWTFWRTGFVLG